MLNEKIKIIMNLLDITNAEIAAYSGCSVTNLSRMASGSRVADKDNPTIMKFVEGVYMYSEENYLKDKLCEVIGCAPDNDEYTIKKSLSDWLYEGVSTRSDNKRRASDIFSRRMKMLIELANISNIDLSRMANIDISYINRMLRGDRVPKEGSKLLDNLCMIITDEVMKNGDDSALAEMLGVPAERFSEIDRTEAVRNWLRGKNDLLDVYAAEQTLKFISSVTAGKIMESYAVPSSSGGKALEDDNDIYVGARGLRKAVTRFLGNAAKDGSTHLMLYSDQDMKWMKGRFERKWLSLMSECVAGGVKITIIHNIDRDISELLFAIKNWLPLYMTGLMESYYCIDSPGSRFTHTMFISPDSCIDGFCPAGSEENSCIYKYSTDKRYLKKLSEYYDKLLKSSRPLLTYCAGETELSDEYEILENDEMKICTSERSAAVIRLSDPKCSFVFSHPLMIQAFKAFTENDRCRAMFRKKTDGGEE